MGIGKFDLQDDYCFEYPTLAYENGINGKTLRYSKASMSDLVIFVEGNCRITIEAKYTEFIEDSLYKPLLKEWLKGDSDKNHRRNIAQCWLNYICKNECCNVEDIEKLKDCDFFPYQFLHRTASACFNCDHPILIYQLFFDKDNIAQMKKFESLLCECAKTLGLSKDKLPFYILEVEVDVKRTPKINDKKESSSLFDKMKENKQYCFSDDLKILNGYTLKEIC